MQYPFSIGFPPPLPSCISVSSGLGGSAGLPLALGPWVEGRRSAAPATCRSQPPCPVPARALAPGLGARGAGQTSALRTDQLWQPRGGGGGGGSKDRGGREERARERAGRGGVGGSEEKRESPPPLPFPPAEESCLWPTS